MSFNADFDGRLAIASEQPGQQWFAIPLNLDYGFEIDVERN
jgi:hypothetical protein